MIEVKDRTHTIRMFATDVSWKDLFWIVLYTGYRGDPSRIPWYYSKRKGATCVTDLTQSMDDIMASMKSNTRNEIRRAMKEECRFEVTEDVDGFVKFYNDFCASKNFPDFTNRARLAKYEKVLLTKAMHGDTVLAMHANILDEKGKIALLLFSCSQRLDENVDRKLIGWGNRFLHYKELEYLKEQGYTSYDWSGICLDPNDEKYSIGQFKLAFGGKLTDSWILKSPLYSLLEGLRNKLVKLRK